MHGWWKQLLLFERECAAQTIADEKKKAAALKVGEKSDTKARKQATQELNKQKKQEAKQQKALMHVEENTYTGTHSKQHTDSMTRPRIPQFT